MRYITLLIVIVAGLSCTSRRASAPSATGASKPHGAVISRIVGKHDVIVVRAGSSGPTYSVETKEGTVLVAALTLEELAEKKPDLLRAIQTMYAGMNPSHDTPLHLATLE